MTYANLIMLGLGLVAFAFGVTLLVRPAATPQGAYARRISGAMLLALGIALSIFAFGLKGVGR